MNVPAKLPTRHQYIAYVTADMEATGHFHEDLIGLPMVEAWCETAPLSGVERVYGHCFFEIAGGGALAVFRFFQNPRIRCCSDRAAHSVPPHRAIRLAALNRWLGGDHTRNNVERHDAER